MYLFNVCTCVCLCAQTPHIYMPGAYEVQKSSAPFELELQGELNLSPLQEHQGSEPSDHLSSLQYVTTLKPFS